MANLDGRLSEAGGGRSDPPCVSMLTAKDISYRSDHSGAIAAITTTADAAKFNSDIAIRLCVGGADGWDDFASEITEQSDNFQAETVDIEDPASCFTPRVRPACPKAFVMRAEACSHGAIRPFTGSLSPRMM